MPVHHPPTSAGKTRNTRQQQARRNIDLIVARREQLVAEIALMLSRGEGSRLIDNAQQLLTRWWSSASWNAREKLLKTADWMVGLERTRAEQLQS